LVLGKVQKVVLLSVIRPRLDVPYALPLIGFDAYPILAGADEIGVLLLTISAAHSWRVM
jgi:hypothetical protein